MKSIILFFLFSFCSLPHEVTAQWVEQNSGSATTLTDIVMIDSNTAIAVGRNSSILRTTNAGATWFDVVAHLSFTMPWNGVSFFDSANGIVVGDEGVVFTTTNGGIGWRRHDIPGGQKCFSVIHTGQYGYLVGADSGWVYESNDTGHTWTSEKISKWPIRSLFKWRGTVGVGAPMYYALTPYSYCLMYIIPPPAWSEKIIPQFQGLGSEGFSAEFCNGGSSGFIVGVQGDYRADPTILRKKTSDTAWNEISIGVMKDGVLLGVSAPSANVVYVCGSGGMIFKSTNGGDTWRDISVPIKQSLNAIYFYDENRGFTVGDSGKIFFTSNGGGITNVEDEKETIPSNYELYQNFPNPFNPSTTISFSIPIKDYVSLKIYDCLGREIATLLDEEKTAGKYSVQWEASTVASGLYIYRLECGKYSAVKKLLVIR